MNQILIVEDDRALADGITLALASADIQTYKAHTLLSARDVLASHTIDVVLLDVNLPDGNGMELLEDRASTGDAKIIMLTANDMESDIVSGLERGADDYITKPFSLAVLRARVNTQLRKVKASMDTFTQGGFHFDFAHMLFSVDGENVELSKTEQKVLHLLTANKNITMERAHLIDRIWTDGAAYVDENALSVTVKRLRTKLNNPDCLKTVYGIGYRWEG